MSDQRKDDGSGLIAIIAIIAAVIAAMVAFVALIFLSICAIAVFRLKRQTSGFNFWDWCSPLAGFLVFLWALGATDPELPALPFLLGLGGGLAWFCLVNLRLAWLMGERLSNGERLYNIFWGDLRLRMPSDERLPEPSYEEQPRNSLSASSAPEVITSHHPDSDNVRPRRQRK